jgi:hypothetical protein
MHQGTDSGIALDNVLKMSLREGYQLALHILEDDAQLFARLTYVNVRVDPPTPWKHAGQSPLTIRAAAPHPADRLVPSGTAMHGLIEMIAIIQDDMAALREISVCYDAHGVTLRRRGSTYATPLLRVAASLRAYIAFVHYDMLPVLAYHLRP